ncbi:MAG TPA: hypothetical protein ENF79_04680 [Nitrososphaeria archaeon]|nr:hypothetical protein [Nitrososphaeria archaeon]
MSFISEADSLIVKRFFKNFYRRNSSKLYVPSRLPEREFGYFTFEKKLMVRHLSFNSPQELWEKIAEDTPLHIYHSAAFYKYPRAPMDSKSWLGAELIFDIDADHLKTPCGKKHDFKVCKRCRRAYPVSLDLCPDCGQPLMKVEWVCDLCLEAAREEARKLLGFLEDDFGFQRFRAAFSGNRGYHLVVEDESILELDQAERKELIDYITGTGLSMRLMGLEGRAIDLETAPKLEDLGWRGRIARAAFELLASKNYEALREVVGDSMAQTLIDEIEEVSKALGESVPWNLMRPKLRRALFEAAREIASAHIDVVVTQDVHRLLRLGNSLNGKTGLMAKMFDPNELDELEPMSEAVALPMDEELTVYVIRAPRFKLGEVEFEACESGLRRLPAAAAILLLCKGAATLP